MLSHAHWNFEQPCRTHQRRTSRNNAITAIDVRRKLRLYIDDQQKRLFGLQAHHSA